MLAEAVAFSDFVLALHILAVIAGFGITFAYPLLLSAAVRADPSVMPWLLGARQRLSRSLVNPGLLVVVVAGVYLASAEHRWGSFFVGWGILAAIAIGAIESAFIIPRCARLAELAERDLAATAVPAGGRRTSATWSDEYTSTARQLARASAVLQLIVVVTVVLMATHA
jgi:hypothetical protein